ncbi:hypothetical protein LTR37_010154 [Vermiconidia calcicola]|uniref:Uncharacterized protein n=1 Tax=Vermiconidia calcicola TaxID=1690605 RepID=A0ACC3N740_9PEZI|nr:hypothetical protein LTR37_010154 [Vermiconidia calcicola]
MPPAAYYDRAAPYAYYEQPRQGMRQEYPERVLTRTMIHEPEGNETNEQTRRRIAVACSRCRRRKIKCSGDPGDDSGCSACKTSGADIQTCCTFNRVNSQPLAISNNEPYPQNNTNAMARPSHSIEPVTCHMEMPFTRYTTAGYPLQSRQSLPTLHTRSAMPNEYEAQYESSPLETYNYSLPGPTMPRQDSFSSSYGLENYRSWPTTTGPMYAAPTTAYYEPQSVYTFGSIGAPSVPLGQQQTGRLPSVTADSFSALNMGHLNSSLPAQTVQERRLPIPAPHTLQQYPQTQYSAAEVPEIRPLGSHMEPRVHINGIHSRNALPWSLDTTSSASRNGSIASYAPPNGMPNGSSQATTAVSEPAFGYQFNQLAPAATSSSPEVSPTSGPALSESFQSNSGSSTTSMLPPSNARYTSSSMHGLPSVTTDDRPTSSRGATAAPAASLYSFSTESSDPQSSMDSNGTSNYPTSARQSSHTLEHNINAAADAVARSNGHYNSPIRQPQPQHATSIGALCRQSSFEQQQQQQQRSSFDSPRRRSSTAHRMSISNFNAPY